MPKDVFLEHFWWCWDRFQAAATPDVPLPAYFRFLTLLGLRIFVAEKVGTLFGESESEEPKLYEMG